MTGGPTRKVYRLWGPEHKAAVIGQARKLLESGKTYGFTALVKKAQVVLPAELRRNTFAAVETSAAYAWFRAGIAAASPAAVPAPLSSPAAAALSPEEKAPAAPPAAAPWPKPGPAAPGGGKPSRQFLGGSAAAGQLSGAFGSLLERLAEEAFMSGYREGARDRPPDPSAPAKIPATAPAAGDGPVLAELRRQAAVLDRLEGVVCNTAAAVASVERRLAVLARSGTVAAAPHGNGAPAAAPAVPGLEVPDPRPRVLVLGVPSGHWENHIKSEASAVCAALVFRKASGVPRPEAFAAWDLVVATKKTPHQWVALASAGGVEKEKLVRVPGGADEIARGVRTAARDWTEARRPAAAKV